MTQDLVEYYMDRFLQTYHHLIPVNTILTAKELADIFKKEYDLAIPDNKEAYKIVSSANGIFYNDNNIIFGYRPIKHKLS